MATTVKMSRNIENIEKGLVGLRLAMSTRELTEIDQETALLFSIKALMDCRSTPCWLKGTNGRMLYINPAYTDKFGVKADKYVGFKDDAHWDARVAVAFRENDLAAAVAGKSRIFIEEVEIEGSITFYEVLKWPVFMEGHLIGIAGEVIGVYSG